MSLDDRRWFEAQELALDVLIEHVGGERRPALASLRTPDAPTAAELAGCRLPPSRLRADFGAAWVSLRAELCRRLLLHRRWPPMVVHQVTAIALPTIRALLRGHEEHTPNFHHTGRGDRDLA